MKGVEEFDDEGFDLDAVHIGELAEQCIGEVVTHEVSIGWKGVWLTLFGVEFDLLVDNLTIDIDGTEQLLEDHGLHFKATDMTIVDHHSQSLSQYLNVHLLVELSGQLGEIFQDNGDCVDRLEAQIHELGLLMLHREDHNHHDVVEHGLFQFKETLCAVFDYIHDEGE